ncbi:MAG: hypothetical protein PVH25_05345 [Burkholderiales bacterium]
MSTIQGIYYDGWGGELYGHHRLAGNVWLAGVVNILEPDADQVQVQDYQTAFALVELRYTFRRFERMLYVNYRFEDSRSQSGEKVPDTFTIGVRWDFP